MLAHLSWTTIVGTTAMILSAVLLFVYLFVLRLFEDERKLQKARKQLLNLPEDSMHLGDDLDTKKRSKDSSDSKTRGKGKTAMDTKMELIQARKRELGLIGSAGTGTLRNRKGNGGSALPASGSDGTAPYDDSTTADDSSREERLHTLVETLTLDNMGENMEQIDQALEETLERVRNAKGSKGADNVLRLFDKYTHLKKQLQKQKDSSTTSSPKASPRSLEWRDNPTVKADEKQLRSRTSEAFTRLKHNSKNGVDVAPVLKELLGILYEIQHSGDAMPVIVTKQIVFCNELMAKDGLSLLQTLKDDKTAKGSTPKMAEQLMETVVPLIWSS